MIEMRVKSPMSGGVTFSQFFPSLREIQIKPSSVPTHNNPFLKGDSSNEKTSAYVSTPVWSFVIGPPDASIVFGSRRASSGETAVQLPPSFVDRKSFDPPT